MIFLSGRVFSLACATVAKSKKTLRIISILGIGSRILRGRSVAQRLNYSVSIDGLRRMRGCGIRDGSDRQHDLQTFPDVQENDGDFHEAVFESQGDKVG